jgi:hypothetical protein
MSPKNRNKLNFYIDIAMFVVMGALIGIGLLIKYALISGQERWALYGQNMELTFWGLDRHEWGTFHLILGGLLFVLLVLHIIFHWRTIVCFFRRYTASAGTKHILYAAILVLFIVLAAFPLFVTPEKEPLDRGEGRRSLENMGVDISDSIRIRLKKPKKLESGDLEMEIERKQENDGEPVLEHQDRREALKDEINITGRMTLKEVSRDFEVPVSLLKRELDLPEGVSSDERLGRLRKRYSFTMGDVKNVVLEHGTTSR